MTIKEFSRKYGVPYHTAYQASYKVQPVSTWVRDRDYPEDQLFEETKRMLSRRAEWYREQMAVCMRMEVNMNRIRRGSDEMPKVRRENENL